MDTQQEREEPRSFRSRNLRLHSPGRPGLSLSGKWLQERIHRADITNERFGESCRQYGGDIQPRVLSRILRDDERFIKCVGERVASTRVLAMMRVLKDYGVITTRNEPYEYLDRLPTGFIDPENWVYLKDELAKLNLPESPEPIQNIDVQKQLEQAEQYLTRVKEITRKIDRDNIDKLDEVTRKKIYDLAVEMSELALEIFKDFHL